MNKIVLGTRGKQALVAGTAGVLLGLPLSLTAGDAPAPVPVAPIAATNAAPPLAPAAAAPPPQFKSQQYDAEVQRQLDLLYQQSPQSAGQPGIPKPPAGPPQPKKMRMKDWFNPTAWKRYNRSRQRIREYEAKQRETANAAPEATLGNSADITFGGAAPLAPAPAVTLPQSPAPLAPAVVAATPQAQPLKPATAPAAVAARPQLQRVSPEIFEIPGEPAAPSQAPAFELKTAEVSRAPQQPRLLPAPGAADASEHQTPTLTIMPEPAVALHAAPPADAPADDAAQFSDEPQVSQGFFDEPAQSAEPLPVADANAADLFEAAAPSELESAESNPFEPEASGPYTGLELDANPFAAPQSDAAAGPEAAVTSELPAFTADRELPAREPVAALLAPPPPAEAADGTPATIPTRLATETTALAAPAPLPAAAGTDRIAATPVSASTEPTDVQRKLSRIAERRGLTGFKGFCPVMLRDYRELVDAKLEHTAQHDGRQYWFSSAAARETFLQNPAAYAPARGGLDVVILDEVGEQRDGSLDHAVWYRGQLYLFDSSETQAAFSAQPQLHQAAQ